MGEGYRRHTHISKRLSRMIGLVIATLVGSDKSVPTRAHRHTDSLDGTRDFLPGSAADEGARTATRTGRGGHGRGRRCNGRYGGPGSVVLLRP